MQFRRVLSPDRKSILTQNFSGGEWVAAEPVFSPFAQDWEIARAADWPEGAPILPLAPLSFRDFMLSERHAVNAARGFARRFMPGASRIASLFEAATGKTFPPFKPSALWRRQPVYYFGNALAFAPSGVPVRAPSYTKAFDYELELGFTLSRPLFNATPEEAQQAIGAFVVVNDFSARDVQRPEMASGFGPQKSKHFLNSMSATAVTADEILPRLDKIAAHVRIDGKRIVSTDLRDMRWSLGEVLAHASRDETLYPGELFATGTLPGGCALENGAWLRPGSHLSLEIEGVGVIEHEILAGDPP